MVERPIADFVENLEQRLRIARGHEADAVPSEFNAASALAGHLGPLDHLAAALDRPEPIRPFHWL